MARLKLMVVAGLFSAVTGCITATTPEQYHYISTYADVPVKIKLAFSEKYPNDVLKTDNVYVQKMWDGKSLYRVTGTDSKGVAKEHVFADDGTEL